MFIRHGTPTPEDASGGKSDALRAPGVAHNAKLIGAAGKDSNGACSARDVAADDRVENGAELQVNSLELERGGPDTTQGAKPKLSVGRSVFLIWKI
jgi:hypothetical protein